MDALSETLRVVQLVGAIFINARFTAPWCYGSPTADSAAPLLEPGAERVVIFHWVIEGECFAQLNQDEPVALVSGGVVVFPEGHAHLMNSRPQTASGNGARLPMCWRGAHVNSAMAAVGRARDWCVAIWRAMRGWRACRSPAGRRCCASMCAARVPVRG